jgi:hypothetical protein
VNGEPQTISFTNPGTQTIGTAVPALAGTATSGLTVSFTSATPNVCAVSGTYGTAVTLVASGTCTINANQYGNSQYLAAQQVQQSFTVNGEPQTISFTNPGTQTIGTAVPALAGTATSGLTVSFTSATLNVCTVSGTYGTAVTLVASGTCTIQATQTGNSTYAAAPPVSQTFTVDPGYYTLGGTVAGLVGSGLVLQDNGANNLAVSVNGAFTFSTKILTGSAYSVTVLSQPGTPTQTCAVTSGSGTVAGANVTSVQVACTPTYYSIGGTVTGLAGSSLQLVDLYGGSGPKSLGSSDNLTVTGNGAFTFSIAISSGTTYSVLAGSPSSPPQQCLVTNGSGTATANVTNIQVVCSGEYTLGGTVSGPAGSGGVNLRNLLSGATSPVINAGQSFAFDQLPNGTAYDVALVAQPNAGFCTVNNGTGTINSANVTNILVSCTPRTPQTITFNNPGTQSVGTPLNLSATASSGLPVSFTSWSTLYCTVSGTTVTFLEGGTCVITANQAGNGTYAVAPVVEQYFTVSATPLTGQTITFNDPGAQYVGRSLTLTATASSGLTVSFASTTTSICTVSGTTAEFVAAGTCTIQATQAGNTTYAAATSVTQSFTVGGDVYVAGYTTSTTTGNTVATYWKNGVPTYLTDGTYASGANSIAVDSKGNVFVAGYVMYTPGYSTTTITLWTNGVPTILGISGELAYSPFVVSVAVDSNDNVYVTGTTNNTAISHIATVWVNGNQAYYSDPFYVDGNFPTLSDGGAIAIDSSNNIYVGGDLSASNANQAAGIWKNGVASMLQGTPSDNYQYMVTAIAVAPNGSVLASGYEVVWTFSGNTVTGLASQYALWINGASETLTLPSPGWVIRGVNGVAFDSENNSYVGGAGIQSGNSKTIICVWKNGVPTLLTDDAKADWANGVAVDQSGDVYVVGSTEPLGSNNSIAAYWENGVVTNLTDGSTDAGATAIFLSNQ